MHKNDTISKKHIEHAITQYGTHALSHTGQQDLAKYFIYKKGYLCYFQASEYQVYVLGDPIAAPTEWPILIRKFLKTYPTAAFYYISKACAGILKQENYYINHFGQEHRIKLSNFTLSWSKTPYLKKQLSISNKKNYIYKENEEINPQDLE
eukprot:COSAG01_NODE_35019_length_538_cov_1.277904_1_plen_150_part_01